MRIEKVEFARKEKLGSSALSYGELTRYLKVIALVVGIEYKLFTSTNLSIITPKSINKIWLRLTRRLACAMVCL